LEFNLIRYRLPHKMIYDLNLRWDQRIETWLRLIINQQSSLPYIGCIKGNTSFPLTTSPFTQTLADQ